MMMERVLLSCLDAEERDLGAEELRELKAAVGEGVAQAARGEGISLDEFDRQMRAKYGWRTG